MTLPDPPEAVVEKALSNSVSLKRCVTIGVRSTAPERISPRAWCQVCHNRRPEMPSTRAALKTMWWFQSNSNGAGATPSRATSPPGLSRLKPWSMAAGAPPPVGRLPHQLDHRVLGGVQRQIGAHAAGEVDPVAADVGGVDGPGADGPRDGDRHQADRAAAGDQHLLGPQGGGAGRAG